ncbi:hypothetical protein AUQ44_01515 [Vibrio cidicii]|uniref:Uncharacterized protein n=1 Tax=Vibrio cidicii TaxID=1763883 RepID=A0A151JFU3_9VIBR|nr:hypothetical protein AUQ44_01515 [Vibrio cidicii]
MISKRSELLVSALTQAQTVGRTFYDKMCIYLNLMIFFKIIRGFLRAEWALVVYGVLVAPPKFYL